MKRDIARHILITKLTALALLTVCFVPINSVTAQSSHVDLYQNIWITGLVHGQTLLYTWVNLNDPDPEKRELEPVRIEVKLLAADGSVIVQTAAPAVSVGLFQSFRFDRNQINLPGEPGSGRLQVRLEVTVIGRLKYSDIVLKQGVLETFDAMAEIANTLTGETTVSSKPKEIVVVGSKVTDR